MNRPSLNHQVGVELFEEWDYQPGGVVTAMLQSNQSDSNQDARPNLIAQLGPGGEAEIAAEWAREVLKRASMERRAA